MNDAILSIGIPTWNRARFLAATLEQLGRELDGSSSGLVEIVVSDNASSDDTPAIIYASKAAGLPIRSIRNSENIGSDANIAQCFNLAQGKYVLILGDDDLFVDGGLTVLLNRLKQDDYGIVCLRPYGFEKDFRREYPGPSGFDQVYSQAGVFLARIGPLVTLISSCVINKRLLAGVDANQFCGSSLVQVHLVIQAALAAKRNVFLNRYLVACTRNNSGGYDFSQVFVSNLCGILDQYKSSGLETDAIKAFERRMMLTYYPLYLFRQRLARSGDLPATWGRFDNRFHGRRLFHYWLKPIMTWPRPFALIWGALVTVVGRVAGGDLRRGLMFALNRLSRKAGLV